MNTLNLTTIMSIEQSSMFECESFMFSSCSISCEQNLKTNGMISSRDIFV